MSNNTFNVTRLAGQRLLVTDGGERETVLDTREWDEYKAKHNVDKAGAEFDAAVKEFFAPLIAASEKAVDARKPKLDPAFYVVEREEVKATPYQQGVVVRLSHDAAVVRILESGDTSRLIWVGNDIEIVEVEEEDAEPIVATDSGDSFDVIATDEV